MKPIPGFKTLKAFKHGRLWYIIDCTEGAGNPYQNSIGGYFETFQGASIFALVRYTGQYS